MPPNVPNIPLRMESPFGAQANFNGKEYDYFSGTGYLGLQTHPAVIHAAQKALDQYGFSTATSRGSYGEHPVYDELEKQASAFFDAEKVLYFPSGYMGVSILTQVTALQFDHIFIDSQAHFSLWDAAQSTNKTITPFHHLSPTRLEETIQYELLQNERPLVLSDAVFPISGEIAPLPDYLQIAKKYRGSVYLDEAHAVGVLGAHGRGITEYFNIDDESCRTSGTLAKALGGYGGIIWGKSDFIESIDRNSTVSIGASPPPLPVAAASAKALEIAHTDPFLLQHLWDNVGHARQGLRDLGWELPDTPVPIICLEAFDDISLERIHSGLFEQGIAVTLARSYSSTPPGGAIRIAIFAIHSSRQIDRLIETIAQLIK